MSYRLFEPHIEKIAGECRRSASTEEDFTVVNPARQGGGTGAVEVRMIHSGQKAWAKPEGTGNQLLKDVANEKIATGLAYDLGLPVAPVTISAKTNGKNLHSFVALSYDSLTSGKPLSQAPADQLLLLRPALSAMFVFMAWIDDHDHFGGSNALFEIVNGIGRLCFFDWGHSLTRAWPIPGAPPQRPQWTNPPAPFHPLDITSAEAILQRIEGFPVKELERIIAGIPPDCLSLQGQTDLTTALDQRRGELRRVLNLTGAP